MGCGGITHGRRNTNVNWNGLVLCKVNGVACTPTFSFYVFPFIEEEQELIAHDLRNVYIIAVPWHIHASKVRTIKPFKDSTSIQVAVQPYFCCFRIFLKPCITFDIFRRFSSQTAKANAYKLHSTCSIW